VADFLQGFRELPLSYVLVNENCAGGMADHNLNLEGWNADLLQTLSRYIYTSKWFNKIKCI
jgi:hypothetical protein